MKKIIKFGTITTYGLLESVTYFWGYGKHYGIKLFGKRFFSHVWVAECDNPVAIWVDNNNATL